jgi:hypothetical protein
MASWPENPVTRRALRPSGVVKVSGEAMRCPLPGGRPVGWRQCWHNASAVRKGLRVRRDDDDERLVDVDDLARP